MKNYILKYAELKRTRLFGLCETRFIQHHDAINAFVDFFQSIIVSLLEIQVTTCSVSLNFHLF